MSLAIERILVPATGQPGRPPAEEADKRLNITVVFTSVEATLAALREAGTLAISLGAQITLLVPQVVPYPLPLESPPVLIVFNERRFRLIASESPVEDQRSNLSLPRSIRNPRKRIESGFTRCARWTEKVVADSGEEFSQQAASSRSRSDFQRDGLSE